MRGEEQGSVKLTQVQPGPCSSELLGKGNGRQQESGSRRHVPSPASRSIAHSHPQGLAYASSRVLPPAELVPVAAGIAVAVRAATRGEVVEVGGWHSRAAAAAACWVRLHAIGSRSRPVPIGGGESVNGSPTLAEAGAGADGQAGCSGGNWRQQRRRRGNEGPFSCVGLPPYVINDLSDRSPGPRLAARCA